MTQKEIMCMKKHTLNVSCLNWSNDSKSLVSGGFDNSCRLWSIDSVGRLLQTFETDGFVQCVQFEHHYPASSTPCFYYGTSRNILGFCDTRMAGGMSSPVSAGSNSDSSHRGAFTITNEGMVNSLHVFQDGVHVLTGDSLGYLKTWDIRQRACVQSHLNEPTGKPISHITTARRFVERSGEEPRFMGVNSYDNVLRIWDRGIMPVPDSTAYRLGMHKIRNGLR